MRQVVRFQSGKKKHVLLRSRFILRYKEQLNIFGNDSVPLNTGLCNPVKGESESGPHWVYCSKFLLAGLCHLMMCLDKLDGKNFQSPQEYQQTINFINLLVRKAEMVFSSHLAYWSALPSTHKHTVMERNYIHFLKYCT